jgi:cytochrome c oxidase subunit 2
MAAFGPQLSDEELAAIVTYQRNAFGNDTGDLVTPDQIAGAR